MKNKIIEGVSNYYSEKIKLHGNTAKGVDWNSRECQYLRFEKLSAIIGSDPFTILDYGSGTGEYAKYLRQHKENFSYTGFDISSDMLACARSEHVAPFVGFTDNFTDMTFDYTISSGIFNVRLDLADDQEWLEYILYTIKKMNAVSKKGFSFNALTKYSDKAYMKDRLFYADPLFLFDYCKLHFSRNVALLHDYDLYEFTLLIRK